MDPRRIFGNSQERRAARFLKSKGLKILDRQYKIKFGEIDIIAKDGDEIVFVEVKARRTAEFGHPEEAVTLSKLNKIAKVAEFYLQETAQENAEWRIDVIAISSNEEINHLIGVFY